MKRHLDLKRADENVRAFSFFIRQAWLAVPSDSFRLNENEFVGRFGEWSRQEPSDIDGKARMG